MVSGSRFGVAGRCAGATMLVLACASMLVACDKSPGDAGNTTVGQKVDAAIDKTRDVAADVRTEAKAALGDAEARYRQDGPEVEARAKDAATRAGKLIDDSAITAQIATRIARDAELSALRIDVDTKNGAVILRGPAPTDAARKRAAELARGVEGVLSVDNQLIVTAG